MSEWISVDDRLPDIETDTLIVCVSSFDGDLFSDTDGFQDGEFVYWPRQTGCLITHWMLLPDPPKKKPL